MNKFIDNFEEQAAFKQHSLRCAKGVRLNFDLPQGTLDRLHAIYDPIRFVPGVSVTPQHAIAAAHQRFAYHQLKQIIADRANIIEIGPNIAQFLSITEGKRRHACSLLSARDQIRFRDAMNSKIVNRHRLRSVTNSVALAASGVSTDLICVNGIENCYYQSDYAYSVHSLYDIRPETLVRALDVHGIHTLYAFIHLSNAMCKVNNYVDHQACITFETIEESGEEYLLMGFPNDQTFAYRHLKSNVLFYITRSGIKVNESVGYVFEKVNNWGSQYYIKISRVNMSITTYSYLLHETSQLVRVPDMFAIATAGYDPYSFTPTYIYADRNKVRKLYTFLLGRDQREMALKHAVNYARTELRTVKIGKQVIEQAWDLSIAEFDRVVIGVYVVAYMQSLRMSEVMQTMLATMVSTGKKTIVSSVVDRITSALHPLLEPIVESIKSLYSHYLPSPLFSKKNYGLKKTFVQLCIDFHDNEMIKDNISLNNEIEEMSIDFTLDNSYVEPRQTTLSEPTPQPTLPKEDDTVEVFGKIVDFGGDGDCLAKVLTHLRLPVYPSLPPKWVALDEYIAACISDGKHYSILLRLGSENAVHTNDVTLRPNICLTIPANRTEGHYTAIEPSAEKLCDAKLVQRFLGGANTIVFDNTPMDFGDSAYVIVHPVRRVNSEFCFKGFAGQVASAVPGYCDLVRTATKQNLTHFQTRITNGPLIINIIANDVNEYFVRLNQWLLDNDYGLVHSINVGGGVWNHEHLSDDEVIRSNYHHYVTLWHTLTDMGTRYIVHTNDVVKITMEESILQFNHVDRKSTAPANQSAKRQPIDSSTSLVKVLDVPKHIREVIKMEQQADIMVCDFNSSILLHNQNASPLAKVIEVARDSFLRTPLQPHGHTLEGIFGVPGSGKTNSLIQKLAVAAHNNQSIIYVGPTNELVRDVEKKLPSNVKCRTLHVAMSIVHTSKPNIVIIDEAFTVPLPIIAFFNQHANLILLGDPAQIGFIDFHKVWGTTTQLGDLYKHIKHDYNNVSYRIPADIAKIPFIRNQYPNIVTRSRKHISLKYLNDDEGKNGCHMVFTQAMKSMYAHKKPVTVHEAQGHTFPSTILHYDDTPGERQLLLNSPNHLVVALTRHTNNLYVVEQTPGSFATMLTMMNGSVLPEAPPVPTPIPPTLQVAVNDLTKVDLLQEEKPIPYMQLNEAYENTIPYQVTDVIPESDTVPKGFAVVSAVEEILDMLYPTSSITEVIMAEKDDLEGHFSTNTLLKLCSTVESTPKTVRRFLTKQRVFITDARRKRKTAHTLLSRYTKITRNLHGTALQNEVKTLYNTIKDFVSIEYTEDDVARCWGDTIKRFQQRGHTLDEIKSITGWEDQNVSLVKFMMKHQQKFSPEGAGKDKAGQGIAAWEKTLNFHMSVWVRLLELSFMRSQKLFYCSGKTDSEVLRILDKLACGQGMEYVEMDWSEFDSSQNNVEHELFVRVMEEIGAPQFVLHQFRQMMGRRCVVSDVGSVMVDDKKDSGRVDTLIGNTLFSSAVVLSLITNRNELHFAGFKGDDVLLAGPNIIIDQQRIQWLHKSCGFTLKIKSGPSAEFTSFICSPEGSALNIPKLAAKVFTRVYSTADHYAKYQVAVGDLTRSLNEEWGRQVQIAVNHLHHSLSIAQLQYLCDALRGFRDGHYPYDDLISHHGIVAENLSSGGIPRVHAFSDTKANDCALTGRMLGLTSKLPIATVYAILGNLRGGQVSE
ncbi:RNA-dependent RNA polymerase [Likani virus]|nr:RNA-dependent RNA polymerase [Likani virus]